MTAVKPAVLFVCTANICRSPMAEALFRDLIVREVPGGKGWQVASAGTWAVNGQRASDNSVKVMANRSLDISAHRSKIITAELIANFDLILVMEAGHKEALRIEFAKAASKVFMLTELSGPAVPIVDPYGASEDRYEKTAKELEQYIQAGLPKMLELMAKSNENR